MPSAIWEALGLCRNYTKSLSGIETIENAPELLDTLGRNYTKSLSGIETFGCHGYRQSPQAAITLNPYQGLKLTTSSSLVTRSQAAITLNPYQGLKQPILS